ncbi:MAG TPA: DNA mismatch repair endonuclease MutL, partial [Dehalococcoidia bacterium]|nr:DNA mismatch repair endonuclease MutL [Dehalococcoidia bacterium]
AGSAPMPIRILPADVAARIAAGEVIERPASIVKELVENALDAGATRISVEITGGGIDSIRVSDDGCGIEPDELITAFGRHATSKLEPGDDLSQILTLGFRGEALPSVAAVGEVEVVSRPIGGDSAGRLKIGPDREPERTAGGAAPGTTITVRDVFARQPARRKFLRTPSSEGNAVAAVVTSYALAYPEIRFALSIDGRETLRTDGSGDLRDAVSAVYGAETAAAMLRVRPGEGPMHVEGLAAPPHISRAGRNYVSLFVNRRWIQNRRLAFAVEEAYQSMLMTGRHPIAVLNIRIPHEEVDVNVHPTKAEVRFRDESVVFGAVQRAVRQALLAASPVPGGYPAAGPRPTLTLSGQASAPPLWTHALEVERRAGATAGVLAPEAATGVTPAQALPVLRVIGQFGAIYIIAEGPDGMYLIDQHAAHERVLYERFVRGRAEAAADVQGLLDPLSLEVSPRHRALLAGEGEALRAYGLEVEPFGESAYLVRAVPRSLAAGEIRDSVVRFLDLMLEEGEIDGRDRVAMSLACHGAVRAGKTLSLEEMRDLVRQLEESEAPNTCPHGRPTMILMSADVLAREFGRR